jgi:glycosyltransferase involved in cell wall biosynthesis/capsular polysaccharide biosynthesis protein
MEVGMSKTKLSVLHVVVRAGPTNSQYNEHCLPALAERRITVCSLFPADVTPPPALRVIEGDGTRRGCSRALRTALDLGPYDVVHVHAPASGVLTLATYLRTRRSRRNLVFTVHNSWPNFRRRNRLFLYWILALFPVVVTCGESARDSLPRSVRLLFGRRIGVVQNGVDLDRVDRCRAGQDSDGEPGNDGDPGSDQAPGSDGLEVVSVNRLIPLKDPYTLLDAFARSAVDHDRDRLVLVGDGMLHQEISSALEESGLTRKVRLTGLVQRDEVYRIVSRAQLFVSSSKGEGLPVSVLEAMACGCPVVLSDIAPHREIARLAPGIALFRPGDVMGLVAELTRMRALDPDARRALGEQARQCVVEHFSVRSMNRAYGELYGKVAARNAADHRRSHGRAARAPARADDSLARRVRRNWLPVTGVVLLGAAGGFGYSQVRAPDYQANSSVIVGEVFRGAPTDDSVKASMALAASYADLARREPVLAPVAKTEGIDDWRRLQDKVFVKPGDKNPLLMQIQVTGESADQSTRIAEAVAQQLVTMTRNATKSPATEFAQREIPKLEAEMRQTERRIDSLHKRLDAATDNATAAALEADLQDLRENLIDLQASHAALLDRFTSAGAGEVRIVEHAYAATSPVRPDPLALSLAGTAAGLALAVGWLHLRSGSPRTPGPMAPADSPPSRGGEVRPMRVEQWGPEEPAQERPQREGGRR